MTAFCVGASAVFQYIHELKYGEQDESGCKMLESEFTLTAKIFTFAGRASAGAVFAVLYVFTGELFPTGISNL